MAIEVRCPNPACGKMLAVGEDYAGKTGKCPGCGTILQVPYPGYMPAPVSPGPPPLQARPERQGAPVYPPQLEPRPEMALDPYGERGADTGEPAFDPREPRRRQARPGGPAVGTIICFSIATALLVFLVFVPLFSMFSLTFPAREGIRNVSPPSVGGMIRLTEGVIFVFVTTLLAGFCINSLILYLTSPGRVSAHFMNIGAGLAAGWGLTLLLWTLAFIWDIFVVNNWIKEDRPQSETIAPGIGLWLAVGAALVAMALFMVVVCLRGKTLLLAPCLGGGLLIGTLLATVDVQPWNPGPSKKQINEFKGERKDRPRPKAMTRYSRLIVPEEF